MNKWIIKLSYPSSVSLYFSSEPNFSAQSPLLYLSSVATILLSPRSPSFDLLVAKSHRLCPVFISLDFSVSFDPSFLKAFTLLTFVTMCSPAFPMDIPYHSLCGTLFLCPVWCHIDICWGSGLELHISLYVFPGSLTSATDFIILFLFLSSFVTIKIYIQEARLLYTL